MSDNRQTLIDKNRNSLLEFYETAIRAVDGETCVRNWFNSRINDNPIKGDVYVVAVGKAACTMAKGAFSVLKASASSTLIGGIVISKYGHLSAMAWTDLPDKVELIESAHPVPDQNSLQAGKKLVSELQNLPTDTQLLFLISGGTSSLVELLPDKLSLQDLQTVNQWLLSSGLAINNINLIRQKISLLKQGGLLNYTKAKSILALYISDVSDDDTNIIGSGLLSVDDYNAENKNQQFKDCLGVLPENIKEIIVRSENNKELPARNGVAHHIVANNLLALKAVKALAINKGLAVHLIPDMYDDICSTADKISSVLKKMSSGILVAGGEITVELPEHPGRGGRNQSLALAVASQIINRNDIVFMSIGTDGSDGPGVDAGAIVDGQTCARGNMEGFNVLDCLRRADAGSFLAASSDLILTGPTGTNVMDLYIGLRF